MKITECRSGPYTFRVNVPSTVEEYANLAKRENAVLDDAIDHELAHGTLGDIREAMCAIIEETYKTPRREVGTGKFIEEDGKKVEVLQYEKPWAYQERVAAEKGLSGERPFQKEADRLCAGGDREVKFDPSVRERIGGGGKLATKWKNIAVDFLSGKKNLPAFLKVLARDLGKQFQKTNTDADVEVLGRLCKEWADTQDVFGAVK